MKVIKPLLKKLIVPPEMEAYVDSIPKTVGSYGYDPWGYNSETVKICFAVFKFIYDRYFRVKAHGLEHVPARGRVLIIANHSGQLPLDGLLIGTALGTNPHGPRAPRAMVERFFPTVPYIGNLINQFGGVVGDPVNCSRMLENEESVIVFPEGVRGSGKLFKDRYRLQRFGDGFMHLAVNHNTPVVPVGVVGCEETIPAVANIKPLAKLLGFPYVPLAAPVILPARVILNFGEPMVFNGEQLSDAEIEKNVEQVKRAIEKLINKGLAERKGWFK